MTQLETLALQGRSRVHTGLAGLDVERLKRLRSQTMRLCFSHITEERYRMEFVARVRGMEFINDAASRTPNATWFSLSGIDGGVVWIVSSAVLQADYRRILPVAREKVRMMVCLGEGAQDLRQAFGGVVGRIEEASSVREAVHVAYRSGLEGVKVLFSPAGESGRAPEQEGRDFTDEVNEL